MDLLSYLKTYEPNELVHFSGKTYTTKTHDSLKISNGKWMWWSKGIGGNNALSYLIKVQKMSLPEATARLLGRPILSKSRLEESGGQEEKDFSLPDKNISNDRVIAYLKRRGIDPEIIEDCIRKGVIYESLPYHNVVFVGMDEAGVPKYAGIRSANQRRLIFEQEGSDKRFSFRLTGSENCGVHVFESAIDALSYATILKQNGLDWRAYNLLSLGGVSVKTGKAKSKKLPAALNWYLETHPETLTVTLHLDNDQAGRTATVDLIRKLNSAFDVVDIPPLYGKDVNDFLCGEETGTPIEKRERSLER